MTEEEWLTCTNPESMLNFVKGKVSFRKRLWFAVACCRRIFPSLKHERARQAVKVLESMPDEDAEPRRLRAFLRGFQGTQQRPTQDRDFLGEMIEGLPLFAVSRLSMFKIGLFNLASAVAEVAVPSVTRTEDDWDMPSDPHWRSAFAEERTAQAVLLHDIFGNPFGPHLVRPYLGDIGPLLRP